MREQVLGGGERGGRGAEMGERKERDGLVAAPGGFATDDDDGNRRHDQPERCENGAGQAR